MVRMFCVLFVASVVAACESRAPPVSAAGSTNRSLPPPALLPVSSELNTTQLVVEPVAPALSEMSVRFATPELGQSLPTLAARTFEVRLLVESAEADALGVDVAVDDQRPRRLSPTQLVATLGELTRADGELLPGQHWLFAAPVLASGLVPRRAPGAPRAAVAQRFFLGAAPRDTSGPSGALWLRKPEGTYNGASARHVLFDAFAFDESGALLEPPCTVLLQSPKVNGELRLPAPFAVRDVPGGDYEVTLSRATLAPQVTRFTVNGELGGGGGA